MFDGEADDDEEATAKEGGRSWGSASWCLGDANACLDSKLVRLVGAGCQLGADWNGGGRSNGGG